MSDVEIRNAATVIVLRDQQTNPRILMGQRGKKAVFMPNKFVFPGGALDAEDAAMPLAGEMHPDCMLRLRNQADPTLAEPLILAAIRELWEETGLVLGARAVKHDAAPISKAVPENWRDYVKKGFEPTAQGMSFVFRAITPPGRPRRFDARFFLVDADRIATDLDDFSSASDELAHLQWVPLQKARDFDLPFITEVVLAEVQANLAGNNSPGVPFFYNEEGRSHFLRL
jgi:8-oxo-dGTP pyrophosphatase MutT (NUDIX family)